MPDPTPNARGTCGAFAAAAALCLCLAACEPPPGPVLLEAPAGAGALYPRLHSDAGGGLWLSWLEPRGDGHALRYSSLGEEGWSLPREVAEGSDWFVNWADFPSVAHLGDGRLAAHWLRKLQGGPYAYEVRMSVSTDGGETWSAPVPPHADATATEHGFVSLYPSAGGAGAVWLDGRHTSGGGHDHGQHHGHGAMTLRAGGLDWSGAPLPEYELDARVCDCCGTGVASSRHGTTVVYRGRSENEIRDILAVTLGPEGWTAPVPVSADGWEMPACPVNGPALAVHEDELAVAWFTAADQRPRVLASFSSDGGREWSEPAEVAGAAALGRVAIVMPDSGSAIVSWMETTPDGAEIRFRRVSRQGQAGAVHAMTTTSPARSSGFPQMALAGGRLVFAWTRPGEEAGVVTATTPLP
jgi:hypothetical protein